MENKNTHVTTKPNKANDPLSVVKHNLNEKYLVQVVNYFNGDKRAAMRFMTGYVDYIRRVPKLLECSPLSLINAAMTIASFRFTPSSVAGEAYIIPYGTEATFQPGYQGYVTLFYRAGVRAIQAEIVREKDDFTLENGVPQHKIDPRLSKEARGKAIGVYVKVVLPSGEPVYKYMNGEDIIAHAKRFSKAFTKPDSPWNEKNDPELHMWKKTALLQMKSMLPKNSELTRAMEEDFKDSTVSANGMLDAGGPGTGRALHAPEEKEPEQKDDVDFVPDLDQVRKDEQE
jgi:recombination protein RecT